MSDAVDCDGLPGERRRIVIADDHEPTRVLLRTLIELEGMQVVGEARDGSEAVALALEHEPDLVLLDINMPRLDGLGAAEIIRARRPSIGLFLHSGEPLDAALERAAALEVPVAVGLLDRGVRADVDVLDAGDLLDQVVRHRRFQ